MDNEEDIDITENQVENSAPKKKDRAPQLRPWRYKKGQSGNPAGRPPGKSLKEYVRSRLAAMTDEEREKFLHGIEKDVIWEMAEGKPQTDITSGGQPIVANQIVFTEFDKNVPKVETKPDETTGQ